MVTLIATALAPAGTPHSPATGKARSAPGRSAGPPLGPLARRVSASRQGETMKKPSGGGGGGWHGLTRLTESTYHPPPMLLELSSPSCQRSRRVLPAKLGRPAAASRRRPIVPARHARSPP